MLFWLGLLAPLGLLPEAAGFGVTAPDQHYDDYARIAAKGKIIVIASGAPVLVRYSLRRSE